MATGKVKTQSTISRWLVLIAGMLLAVPLRPQAEDESSVSRRQTALHGDHMQEDVSGDLVTEIAAIRYLKEVRESARQEHDVRYEATLTLALAKTARRNPTDSIAYLREAKSLLTSNSLNFESAVISLVLGRVLDEEGNKNESLEVLRQCVALAQKARATPVAALDDSLARKIDEFASAIFELAGLHTENLSSNAGQVAAIEAIARFMLGHKLVFNDAPKEAGNEFLAVLGLDREFSLGLEARVLALLGRAARLQDNFIDSLDFLEKALTLVGGRHCGERGELEVRACFDANLELAQLQSRAGAEALADLSIDRSIELARNLESPFLEALALMNQGVWKIFSEDKGKLLQTYNRLRGLLSKKMADEERASVLSMLGQIANVLNKSEESLALQFAAEAPSPGRAKRQDSSLPLLFRMLSFMNLGHVDGAMQQIGKLIMSGNGSREEKLELAELVSLAQNVCLGEATEGGALVAKRRDLPLHESVSPSHLDSLAELLSGSCGEGAGPVENMRRLEELVASSEAFVGKNRDLFGKFLLMLRSELEKEWKGVAVPPEILDRLGLDESYARRLETARILTHVAEGRFDLGLELLRDRISEIEKDTQQTTIDEIWLDNTGQARLEWDLLVALELSRGNISKAFAAGERARAESLSRLGNQKAVGSDEGSSRELAVAYEIASQRVEELEQKVESTGPHEQRSVENELRLARMERNEALLRIKLGRRGYLEFASRPQEVDIGALQSHLTERVALVSYFLLPKKTVIWLMTSKSLIVKEVEIDRSELERQVRSLRSWISMRPRRGLEVVEASRGERGENLFDKLIAPIRSDLGAEVLVIVGSGALHELPFAALRNPENGRFLGQDFELVVVPSATSVLEWGTSDDSLGRRAVVLGDPIPPVRGLSRLKGARAEAKWVGRKFDSKPVLGQRASEGYLLTAISGADVVHIAAHGIRNLESPRDSFLALSRDATHDGRLRVGEIYEEVVLPRRPLVVLSACQSGLGKRRGIEEVDGFVRALLHAGARAVLSTLWSIDDQASSLLMRSFYENLASGLPVSTALKKAQGRLIADPRFRAPIFWAGFELSGNPSTRVARAHGSEVNPEALSARRAVR
jgi:CHAT domain-containing protein